MYILYMLFIDIYLINLDEREKIKTFKHSDSWIIFIFFSYNPFVL